VARRLEKLAVAILGSAYFIYYASSATDWHFIDNLNLIIHEAGHWIFLPFGEFLHVLGGSLFQTIFPLIYVGYFYFRNDLFSAALLLFWVGQNLINVSVYAGDAQVMQLPLLGGDAVIHDWNFILSYTHTLQYTAQIASCIYGAGIIVIILAAAISMYASQLRADIIG
jgi:hypothetical protein